MYQIGTAPLIFGATQIDSANYRWYMSHKKNVAHCSNRGVRNGVGILVKQIVDFKSDILEVYLKDSISYLVKLKA